MSKKRVLGVCYECTNEAMVNVNAICKKCYNAAYRKRYKAKDISSGKNAERQRAYNKSIRQLVLDAYGCICRCCGETTPEFLALDHKYNNGAEHRRQVSPAGSRYPGGGLRIYRDLRRRGFPQDEYQLLCHNCNCAKQFYGRCPHDNLTSDICLG